MLEKTVWTGQDLFDGKVHIRYSGNQFRLEKVLSEVFPDDESKIIVPNFYFGAIPNLPGIWFGYDIQDLDPDEQQPIFVSENEIQLESDLKPN